MTVYQLLNNVDQIITAEIFLNDNYLNSDCTTRYSISKNRIISLNESGEFDNDILFKAYEVLGSENINANTLKIWGFANHFLREVKQ